MPPDEIDFCTCSDFLYENGKCSDCGKWIDDPKEFAKNQRLIKDIHFLSEGECDCKIPSMDLNGVCEECSRKVALVDPKEFFKSKSEESSKTRKYNQQEESSLPDNIVFCTSCGRKFLGGENFCGGCGQEIRKKISEESSNKDTIHSPLSDKKGSGKVIVGILLALGLLLLLYPSISKGGNSGGNNSNGTGNDSEGQWVSKCRLVNVPNPQYPGDQVPLSERIGIPKFVAEQRCTDVFVP